MRNGSLRRSKHLEGTPVSKEKAPEKKKSLWKRVCHFFGFGKKKIEKRERESTSK